MPATQIIESYSRRVHSMHHKPVRKHHKPVRKTHPTCFEQNSAILCVFLTTLDSRLRGNDDEDEERTKGKGMTMRPGCANP